MRIQIKPEATKEIVGSLPSVEAAVSSDANPELPATFNQAALFIDDSWGALGG